MKKIISLMLAAIMSLSFVACSEPVESNDPVESDSTEIVEQEDTSSEEEEEFVVDAQLIENILDGYYGNGQARLDKLAEEGFTEEEIEIIRAEVSRVYKERHPESN